MTERKLITGLKKGEMSAYEQAFHLYYPRFVRFAEYIVKDLSTAKDLVQNVFLKVWRYRDRLDESLSQGSYLYVLTKREVLNHLRACKATEPVEAMESLAEKGSDPERRADVALVREQFSQLPPQRRRVFEMSRLQGMSNREIARALSLSEKTVERHITLAGKQLREAFVEEIKK